mmetsp:Transcript_26145/g.66358  ORF Transcript_26145/g.66358 Transcript_26145/m.66358 type:complete len:1572 (-) Transcript_26145:2225-6940(-)
MRKRATSKEVILKNKSAYKTVDELVHTTGGEQRPRYAAEPHSPREPVVSIDRSSSFSRPHVEEHHSQYGGVTSALNAVIDPRGEHDAEVMTSGTVISQSGQRRTHLQLKDVNVHEEPLQSLEQRPGRTPSPIFFSFYGLEGISPLYIGGGFKVAQREGVDAVEEATKVEMKVEDAQRLHEYAMLDAAMRSQKEREEIKAARRKVSGSGVPSHYQGMLSSAKGAPQRVYYAGNKLREQADESLRRKSQLLDGSEGRSRDKYGVSEVATPRPRSASVLYPPMFTGGLPPHLKPKVEDQFVVLESRQMGVRDRHADRALAENREMEKEDEDEDDIYASGRHIGLAYSTRPMTGSKTSPPPMSQAGESQDGGNVNDLQPLEAVRARGFLPHPRMREAMFFERKRVRDVKEAAEYYGVDPAVVDQLSMGDDTGSVQRSRKMKGHEKSLSAHNIFGLYSLPSTLKEGRKLPQQSGEEGAVTERVPRSSTSSLSHRHTTHGGSQTARSKLGDSKKGQDPLQYVHEKKSAPIPLRGLPSSRGRTSTKQYFLEMAKKRKVADPSPPPHSSSRPSSRQQGGGQLGGRGREGAQENVPSHLQLKTPTGDERKGSPLRKEGGKDDSNRWEQAGKEGPVYENQDKKEGSSPKSPSKKTTPATLFSPTHRPSARSSDVETSGMELVGVNVVAGASHHPDVSLSSRFEPGARQKPKSPVRGRPNLMSTRAGVSMEEERLQELVEEYLEEEGEKKGVKSDMNEGEVGEKVIVPSARYSPVGDITQEMIVRVRAMRRVTSSPLPELVGAQGDVNEFLENERDKQRKKVMEEVKKRVEASRAPKSGRSLSRASGGDTRPHSRASIPSRPQSTEFEADFSMIQGTTVTPLDNEHRWKMLHLPALRSSQLDLSTGLRLSPDVDEEQAKVGSGRALASARPGSASKSWRQKVRGSSAGSHTARYASTARKVEKEVKQPYVDPGEFFYDLLLRCQSQVVVAKVVENDESSGEKGRAKESESTAGDVQSGDNDTGGQGGRSKQGTEFSAHLREPTYVADYIGGLLVESELYPFSIFEYSPRFDTLIQIRLENGKVSMFASSSWSLLRAEPKSTNVSSEEELCPAVIVRSAKKGCKLKQEVSFACWEALAKMRKRKMGEVAASKKERAQYESENEGERKRGGGGGALDGEMESDDEVKDIAFGEGEGGSVLWENEMILDGFSLTVDGEDTTSDEVQRGGALSSFWLVVFEGGVKWGRKHVHHSTEERGKAEVKAGASAKPTEGESGDGVEENEESVVKDSENENGVKSEEREEYEAVEDDLSDHAIEEAQLLKARMAVATILQSVLNIDTTVEARFHNAVSPSQLPPFERRHHPSHRRGSENAGANRSRPSPSFQREKEGNASDEKGGKGKEVVANKEKKREETQKVDAKQVQSGLAAHAGRSRLHLSHSKQKGGSGTALPRTSPSPQPPSLQFEQYLRLGQVRGGPASYTSWKAGAYFNGTPRSKRLSATEIKFVEKRVDLTVATTSPSTSTSAEAIGSARHGAGGGVKGGTSSPQSGRRTMQKGGKQGVVKQPITFPIGCVVENFETHVIRTE